MIRQAYFGVVNIGVLLLGQRRVALIFLLTLVTTILDVVGVVLIADICVILINQEPETSIIANIISWLAGNFFVSSSYSISLVIFYSLVLTFIARTIVNLLFYWMLSVAVFAIRGEAETTLSKYIASCSVSKIRAKTQNEGIRDFITDLNTLASCVRASASLTVELAILLILSGMIVIFYPVLVLKTLPALCVFGYIMLVLLRTMRSFGEKRRDVEADRYENLLILLGLANEIRVYDVADRALREMRGNTDKLVSLEQRHFFLTFVPRYVIEVFAVGALVALFIFLDSVTLASSASVFIGVVIFRVLPSVNRVASTLNVLAFSHKTIDQLGKGLREAKAFLDVRNHQVIRKKTDKHVSEDMNLIEVQNLSAKVGERMLFNKLNVNLPNYGLVVLSGPSGSGKTTFLEILMGLTPKNGSDIHWTGKIKNNKPVKYGFVSQNVLLFERNLKKNIEFFGPRITQKKLEIILCSLGLKKFLGRDRIGKVISSQGSVSGGERQRIGLARALVRDSNILALDEVTSNLDQKSAGEIINILQKIAEKKLVLFVTHDAKVLASATLVIEFT